ncbi:hypothetical protein HPB47_015100, partial [Ixodes persulcatus]
RPRSTTEDALPETPTPPANELGSVPQPKGDPANRFPNTERPGRHHIYWEWTQQLRDDIDRATKKVQATSKTPAIDPHPLHFWETRRGLSKLWRKQKLNRKLKLRIAELTREAEEHATNLVESNWYMLFEGLQGKPRDGQNLGPFKEHESRYIATGPRPRYEDFLHTGTPSSIDAESEVRVALSKLTRNTAPGKNGVSYKALKNLDDASITALTTYFNEVWCSGSLQKE